MQRALAFKTSTVLAFVGFLRELVQQAWTGLSADRPPTERFCQLAVPQEIISVAFELVSSKALHEPCGLCRSSKVV